MNLNDLISKQLKQPPRILLYSTPGWGKTTFAASMPKPIFIDAEDGLFGLDVDPIKVQTYDEVEGAIRALINEDHEYKTVILDTTSSIEKMIFAKVCEDHSKTSIEEFGYAKGYVFAMTHWEKILSGMEKLRQKGMAPVLLAHSEIKTINAPTVDPYDKYMLKMHRHPAARLTEWADFIFFGENKIFVAEKGEGFDKKAKGIGSGERVLYTEERPAFLAKSRKALPYEIVIPKFNGWDAVNQHLSGD